MLILDVVDLYHKNDEIHQERTVPNLPKMEHFQEVMINLNTNIDLLNS